MAVFIRGTIPAKQSESKVYRAVITDIRAGFAGSAFSAPDLRDIIAGIALGAVGSLFRRAIGAHVAAFLAGATVTDLRTRATRALAAFVTQLYTLIARKAFAAIR